MGLSFRWRAVLTKLAEYGEDGVVQRDFIDLLGGADVGHNNPVKTTLGQMFWERPALYETHPLDVARIRITQAGIEAMK